MVNEALEAILNARRNPVTAVVRNEFKARYEVRLAENMNLIEHARNTPWEWPKANVYSQEDAARALKEPSYHRKTLGDLRLFKEPKHSKASASLSNFNEATLIWDFNSKSWVTWAPEKSKHDAAKLLWKCAQMVLRVMFFCNHRCEVEALSGYIPEELAFEVFTAGEWRDKVMQEERNLVQRLLEQVVVTSILPRWRTRADFPKPFDFINYSIKHFSPQFSYFIDRALHDPEGSAQFYGRLESCVNWKTICEKQHENQAAYEWGISSFAAAVDLAYRLGYGSPGREKTPTVPNSGRSSLTILREMFKEESDKIQGFSLESLLLQEEFGQDQKTSNNLKPRSNTILSSADKNQNSGIVKAASTGQKSGGESSGGFRERTGGTDSDRSPQDSEKAVASAPTAEPSATPAHTVEGFIPGEIFSSNEAHQNILASRKATNTFSSEPSADVDLSIHPKDYMLADFIVQVEIRTGEQTAKDRPLSIQMFPLQELLEHKFKELKAEKIRPRHLSLITFCTVIEEKFNIHFDQTADQIMWKYTWISPQVEECKYIVIDNQTVFRDAIEVMGHANVSKGLMLKFYLWLSKASSKVCEENSVEAHRTADGCKLMSPSIPSYRPRSDNVATDKESRSKFQKLNAGDVRSQKGTVILNANHREPSDSEVHRTGNNIHDRLDEDAPSIPEFLAPLRFQKTAGPYSGSPNNSHATDETQVRTPDTTTNRYPRSPSACAPDIALPILAHEPRDVRVHISGKDVHLDENDVMDEETDDEACSQEVRELQERVNELSRRKESGKISDIEILRLPLLRKEIHSKQLWLRHHPREKRRSVTQIMTTPYTIEQVKETSQFVSDSADRLPKNTTQKRNYLSKTNLRNALAEKGLRAAAFQSYIDEHFNDSSKHTYTPLRHFFTKHSTRLAILYLNRRILARFELNRPGTQDRKGGLRKLDVKDFNLEFVPVFADRVRYSLPKLKQVGLKFHSSGLLMPGQLNESDRFQEFSDEDERVPVVVYS